MSRIHVRILVSIFSFLATFASAEPLNPSVRTVIPSGVRQIISIDYRMARNFGTAMALKAQVLPDNLKQFESALKMVGVNPDVDLNSLTFFSFDDDKERLDNGRWKLDMVGVAAGTFDPKLVLSELAHHKILPTKYHDSDVYALSEAISLTLLDQSLIVLGSNHAVVMALKQRETRSPDVDSNQDFLKRMKLVEKATVWSVLDRQATWDMLESVIGEPSKIQTLAGIQDKIQGSYFKLNFRTGIRFDMDFLTYDSGTLDLSNLLKASILYKKVTTNREQADALNYISAASKPVEPHSKERDFRVRFDADLQKSQVLLRSNCFKAMSSERQELSGLTSGR